MKNTGEWIARIALKSCGIAIFVILIIVARGVFDDWKFNNDLSKKRKEMDKNGISPVTRGGYVNYNDTTKTDTLRHE
jgi:hypothetical protein